MSVSTIGPRAAVRAARSIAKALTPSEDTIDATIVANATLIATIAQGRLDSNVAAEVGHAALMSAAAGLKSLADARHQIITCHRQLTTVRDAQGMGSEDIGCHVGKYPPAAEIAATAVAA